MMTFEEADALFKYDPETGVITHRVDRGRGGRLKAGTEAGSLNSIGYRQVQVGRKKYYTHRLAWLLSTGAWPPAEIDHLNGVKDDNTLSNLRAVTNSENHKNLKRRADNTTGVTGVCWYSRDKTWDVRINTDGVLKYLGRFEDFDDAVRVRKAAELKHGFTGRVT